MTDPLFLLDDIADPFPTVGARLTLAGDEGRHAAVVRRIQPGEMIMIGNGRGRGVHGVVVEVRGASLIVEVLSHLTTTAEPRCFVAAQALAKGDRSELAVEMLTEMGISEILPWQAARSIVRWTPDRAARSLSKWRSTARGQPSNPDGCWYRRCLRRSRPTARQRVAVLIVLCCCTEKPRHPWSTLIFHQLARC